MKRKRDWRLFTSIERPAIIEQLSDLLKHTGNHKIWLVPNNSSQKARGGVEEEDKEKIGVLLTSKARQPSPSTTLSVTISR
jgi:hypothetical protein